MADAICKEDWRLFESKRDAAKYSNLEEFMASADRTPKEVYDKSVSIHNSAISRNGRALEKIIEKFLYDRNIPFLPQAAYDERGVIKKVKEWAVHDIIIDAKVGDNIENKVIISCKTSLRERWKQDETAARECKSLYLVTFNKPIKSLAKYIKAGITLVSIGHLDALETMLSKLAEEFGAQPEKGM